MAFWMEAVFKRRPIGHRAIIGDEVMFERNRRRAGRCRGGAALRAGRGHYAEGQNREPSEDITRRR